MAVVVAVANVLLQDALEAVVVEPSDPREHERHLRLDKAFGGAPSDATARVFGYEPHVRPIGEEKPTPQAARRSTRRGCGSWSGRPRGSTAAAAS